VRDLGKRHDRTEVDAVTHLAQRPAARPDPHGLTMESSCWQQQRECANASTLYRTWIHRSGTGQNAGAAHAAPGRCMRKEW
jgi:hypothetical protein